ncbi:class I SAM-dependent methyltransferase [Flavivirga aquimarina]|uniref:Class I SAM-dependent methyltransferase n=1 Tax=Flavivirga aquimarina TaxID=2027862 RepID=A0ABT8W8P0_9FLAO|nr:class I SAM-dependent methyltransferase [Flavivirga aquimarina]MDO5969483.1 class I SAM-dependent methyltransferase [Flavivirga aquimarina]
MKKILLSITPVIDIFLIPFLIPASLIMWLTRRIGVEKIPYSRKTMLKIGVLPIIDHYYEPLINSKHLRFSLREKRNLVGINWNIEEQLKLLNRFKYQSELLNFSDLPTNDIKEFFYLNKSFVSGDACFWYSIIRDKKPKKIIEIGSGHSTRMAQAAIIKNQQENPNYNCEHICVEPYEMPWLSQMNVDLIRKKVETLDLELFRKLESNDILFIDSSHMIRPQGDVLFEFLEILPILKSGVIVHIHDILSPRDYLTEWITEDIRFWNEQYLLEAFLTNNKDWKIIGAVNFLKNDYFDLMKSKFPKLDINIEPGSFYIQKNSLNFE